MRCEQCGANLPDESLFCYACGNRFDKKIDNKKNPSKKAGITDCIEEHISRGELARVSDTIVHDYISSHGIMSKDIVTLGTADVINNRMPSNCGWILGTKISLDVFSDMQLWCKRKPEKGDHIRVSRSMLYAHHGIYISDDEVIHFTGQNDDSILSSWNNRVIRSTLSEFLDGGELEIRKYTDKERMNLASTKKIVKRARKHLGEGGYNLLFNNCEHFAYKCTFGKKYSYQVERAKTIIAVIVGIISFVTTRKLPRMPRIPF